MKQFTKQNLLGLKAEIQAALNEVAKRNGLDSIKLNPAGTFNHAGTVFNCKFEARTVGKAEDPSYLSAQQMYLRRLDLPTDSIGRQFTSLGQTFQIDRIDPKKWKMPVIAMLVENGKVTTRGYKFAAERIKKVLETQGA